MNEKQRKPSVVCVMNPDDRLLLEGKSQDLSGCITPYEVAEWKKEGYVFPSIKENIIFMQNPLDSNEYVYRTEETDENVATKRINAIETIISLLGGKCFKVLSEIGSLNNINNMVSVDVNANCFDSKGKICTDIDKRVETNDKETIKITAEWDGIYTVENYYKAKAIAEQYGLINDSLIDSLLAQRHPSNPNYIKKKQYKIHVCKDLANNLEIATKLQATIKQAVNVDIDVDIKKTATKHISEVFEFEVEFGSVVIEQNPVPEQSLKSKRWMWWVIGGIVIVGIAVGMFLL